MIEDFDKLERIVGERIVDELDHHNLNDAIENPTVENVVLWIWKRLEPKITGLEELVLWETQTACVVLRRSDLRR